MIKTHQICIHCILKGENLLNLNFLFYPFHRWNIVGSLHFPSTKGQRKLIFILGKIYKNLYLIIRFLIKDQILLWRGMDSVKLIETSWKHGITFISNIYGYINKKKNKREKTLALKLSFCIHLQWFSSKLKKLCISKEDGCWYRCLKTTADLYLLEK